ncbi:MAG: BspA family leucine-rich repeat surface protein, partial [Paludibacteraceae bacterium]|nr:BspA family leucine-rich repeat surface protein [Paludibacteraceae bacterium]
MSKHLRFIGACLCFLFSMTMQAEKGPYGIFSEKDSLFTVYYGEIPEDAYRYEAGYKFSWENPLYDYKLLMQGLAKMRITKSFRDYTPKSLAGFFAFFEKLRVVEGINNIRTDSVTDMTYLFRGCKSLTEINLRSFNTSSVVDMSSMFYECEALTSIDLTRFNTSSVTNMLCMFYGSGLETIDLSSFNMRNVSASAYMFYGMTKLKKIFVGASWVMNDHLASHPDNSKNMFYGCVNVQGEKGTTYDESHVDHTYAHVDGGVDDPGYLTLKTQKKVPYAEGTYSNLKRGPYYPFGYDKLVIKYGYMPASSNAFELNCDGKTWWKNDVDSFFAYSETITIDPSMKEYPLTTTAHMFDNCTSVRYLKGLSNLNTDSVTDMSAMFKGCVSLGKYLDFKDFNTRNVTRMDSMFMDMGRFIAEDETGTSDPDKWKSFRYTLDLRNLDTRNVTSMEKMFFFLYWVDVLDISSFDTRKVTDMSNMFRDGNGYDGKTSCLKTIYVGDNWSTASLINTEAGIFGKELNGGNGGVSALFGGAGTYKDV